MIPPKKESPTTEGKGLLDKSKNTKKFRGIAETSKESYHATTELRATEKRLLLKLLYENPLKTYSRQQLVVIMNLPINHITRVVYDLLNAESIEISHTAKSEFSGRTVEFIKLRRNEL